MKRSDEVNNITEDPMQPAIDRVRKKGLLAAEKIIEANQQPNNAQQLEALKTAIEMYQVFATIG